MALRLNPAQEQALCALLRTRQERQLAEALGSALPEVAARLGERLPSLVTLVIERGSALQLTHLGALGRYLACWCSLGVEFERRPEHDWALQVLQRRGQSQGARVFQLVSGVEEALRRLGTASTVSAESFVAAIAVFDQRLSFSQEVARLQAPWRLEAGPPCDIDRLLARLLPDPAHLWYIPGPGSPTRLPPAVRPDRCELPWPPPAVNPAEPPTLPWPDTLTLLAGLPADGEPATLGLHSSCTHVCDPLRHPLVRHTSATYTHERRGDAARLLSLRLYASPDSLPALPDGGRGIAMAGEPLRQRLDTGACGLRLQGAALGHRSTTLAIYPRTQSLLTWQRSARPALRLPDRDAPARAAPAVLTLEQDGQPLAVPDWTVRLAALETAWLDALERLQGQWERDSGLEHSVLDDASDFLIGNASLTWGWAYGVDGLAGPPRMRVAASLQLIAARLQLRLQGQFTHQGAVCDLSLQFSAEHALQCDWQSPARSALQADQLAPLQVQTRVAGSLATVSRAGGEATLVCRSLNTPTITLQAGLGAHADGAGLQWRVRLALAPVQVEFQWTDPLLGTQTVPRTLLPQTTLLDWSLP